MNIELEDISVIGTGLQKETVPEPFPPFPCKIGSLPDSCGGIVVNQVAFKKRDKIKVTKTMLQDSVLKVDGLNPSLLRLMDRERIISAERIFFLLPLSFQKMEIPLQIKGIGDYLIAPSLPSSCLKIG